MPLTVRIPPDLRDRIDAVRGDVPRERWIRRALEQALSDSTTGGDSRYTKRERDILLDALRIAEPIGGDPAWEALADRIEDQPPTPPRPKGSKR